MRAIKKIVPGANVPVSYLSDSFSPTSQAFAKYPEASRYPKLPFFRTRDGVCVTRWKMTWWERVRFAVTGTIWHSVSLANTNYQPFQLHVICPLSVKPGTTVTINDECHELVETTSPDSILGLTSTVLMSCRGMLDVLSEAEVATIEWNGVIVTIRGHRNLGEFATENEAIAAYAEHMRAKNKGKAPASA